MNDFEPFVLQHKLQKIKVIEIYFYLLRLKKKQNIKTAEIKTKIEAFD